MEECKTEDLKVVCSNHILDIIFFAKTKQVIFFLV